MSQRKRETQGKLPPYEKAGGVPTLDPFEVQNPEEVPLFEFAKWPGLDTIRVEFVDNPRPRWSQVVERVMTKAAEHRKAGRDHQFSQVLVPKKDFEALKEHFGEEPRLSTCIGLVNVYPVNPDGATFVD